MAKEVAVEWNELSSDLVGVIVRFHGQMDSHHMQHDLYEIMGVGCWLCCLHSITLSVT